MTSFNQYLAEEAVDVNVEVDVGPKLFLSLSFPRKNPKWERRKQSQLEKNFLASWSIVQKMWKDILCYTVEVKPPLIIDSEN